MRLAKPILLAVLTLALAAYAFDCGATTPEQAVACCNSMACSSHGHHGPACYKTMTTTARIAARPFPRCTHPSCKLHLSAAFLIHLPSSQSCQRLSNLPVDFR